MFPDGNSPATEPHRADDGILWVCLESNLVEDKTLFRSVEVIPFIIAVGSIFGNKQEHSFPD